MKISRTTLLTVLLITALPVQPSLAQSRDCGLIQRGLDLPITYSYPAVMTNRVQVLSRQGSPGCDIGAVSIGALVFVISDNRISQGVRWARIAVHRSGNRGFVRKSDLRQIPRSQIGQHINKRPEENNKITGNSNKQNLLAAQRILSRLGYSPGPIDGIMGSRTRAAIRQFQASRKLTIDGILGPITKRAIDIANDLRVNRNN